MKNLLFIILLAFFLNVQAQIPYTVDIDSGSAKIKIFNVKIKQHNQNLVLTGSIKRRSYNSKIQPGHINYIIENSLGKILQQGNSKYAPSLSLRRWKHGGKFTIRLPNNLPKNSKIKLSWHKNT